MIDTHAHLDFPQYDQDRDEVIRRAFENEIKAIINVGVDLEGSMKSIEIAEKYENVYASVGLHPDWFTKGNLGNGGDWGNIFEELNKLAKNKKVVAIGETGLDYFRIGNQAPSPPPLRGTSPRAGEEDIKRDQKKGFVAQIEVARELGLPVIVHCREAWEDVYDIIFNFQFSIFKQLRYSNKKEKQKIPNTKYNILDTKFVLHCYSGSAEDTEKFLKLSNVFFSFSGNITFPKPTDRAEQLAEAIRMIPLDRIMLDSDAPYLAPQEFRGKRNEPAHIRYIAERIGEIKNIGFSEVEKVTDENAQEFFGL